MMEFPTHESEAEALSEAAGVQDTPDQAAEAYEDAQGEGGENVALAEPIAEPVEEAPTDEIPESAETPGPDGQPKGKDGKRRWFVIHTYSGYENKVKANLERRIHSMNMQDKIFRVLVPMEDEVEFKDGKRKITPKKVFPGYVLVEMDMDDQSWYVVRNTSGVTGFRRHSGLGREACAAAR